MTEKDLIEEEMSVDQALATAISFHQSGQLQQAEDIYQLILQQFPEYPEALHFLGLLRQQQGNNEAAIGLIEQALFISPDYADAQNNLGNIYLMSGQSEQAISCYRKTLALNSDNVSAHNNLGVLLRDLGLYDESISVFNKAIALMPNKPGFYRNLGNTYKNQGNFAEAINAYRKALSLTAYNSDAYEDLCVMLYLQGNFDEAIPLVKQWLEYDPENPLALHRLASFSGEKLTKASDEYIAQTFDGFAECFDRVLKNLEYKAPFLVADAIQKIFGTRANLSILDAGCGTGLCGPLIKTYAARLEGVDLSAKMLERAVKRDCYHELIHAELVSWISSQVSAYDLIVSADTLVYFGDLSGVCSAVSRALVQGGFFVFTLESVEQASLNEEGFQINPHGRFSHSKTYIETVVAANQLEVVEISPVHLRYEANLPVNGFLVVAQSVVLSL